MAINGQLSADVTNSVVQTTDGSTSTTIYTTPAFLANDGGQIVTFDIVGFDFTNDEVATAKLVVKLKNVSGTPSIVGSVIHLVPFSAGSSTNLVTCSATVTIDGTDLKVNVIGVDGKTIDWTCNRYPSLSVMDNWTAVPTPEDGYVQQWQSARSRWEPVSAASFIASIDNVPLAGDLSGTNDAATVIKIQNNSVKDETPGAAQDGYALVWINANNRFEIASVNELGPPSAGGDLSGSFPNPTVIAIQGNSVASTSPTDGYSLVWSTSNNRWEPGLVTAGTPAGAASGDLSDNYPNPTVIKIQNRGVSSTAPTDGYVLTWVNGSNEWQPKPANISTVSAGGDLSGTYPNPLVDRVTGALSGSVSTVYFGEASGTDSLYLTPEYATKMRLTGSQVYVTGSTSVIVQSSSTTTVSATDVLSISSSKNGGTGISIASSLGGGSGTGITLDCGNFSSKITLQGLVTVNCPIMKLGDTTTYTTSTTVGSAGGASALPSNPTGYITVNINGTDYKLPYYAT